MEVSPPPQSFVPPPNPPAPPASHLDPLLYVLLGVVVLAGAVFAYGWYESRSALPAPTPSTTSASDSACTSFSPDHGIGTPDIYVCNNSLYIRGKLAAHDIPALLGLPPSSRGQESLVLIGADPSELESGFPLTNNNSSFEYYGDTSSPGDTLDTYASLATTTDGMTALIYAREQKSEGDLSYAAPNFVSVLKFAPDGSMSHFNLLPPDPSVSSFVASLDPNESDIPYLFSAQGADAAQIVYMDSDKMYIKDTWSHIESGGSFLFEVLHNQNVQEIQGSPYDFGEASPSGMGIAYIDGVDSTSTPAIYPCAEVSGMDADNQVDQNQVDVLNFSKGTDVPVTSDAQKFYDVVGWSADGSTVLVAEATPSGKKPDTGAACVASAKEFSNFFTYDISTGTTHQNTLPVAAAFAATTQGGGYPYTNWNTLLSDLDGLINPEE